MKLFFAATFLILNFSSAFSTHSNHNSLKRHNENESSQDKKRMESNESEVFDGLNLDLTAIEFDLTAFPLDLTVIENLNKLSENQNWDDNELVSAFIGLMVIDQKKINDRVIDFLRLIKPKMYKDVLEYFDKIDVMNNTFPRLENDIYFYANALKIFQNIDPEQYNFVANGLKNLAEDQHWDATCYYSVINILQKLKPELCNIITESVKELAKGKEWDKNYYIKAIEAFKKINASKFNSIILGVRNVEQDQKLSAYDLHHVIRSFGNIDSERYDSIIQHMKDLADKQDWNTDCPPVYPHIHHVSHKCRVQDCCWRDGPVGAVIEALGCVEEPKVDIIKHYTKKIIDGKNVGGVFCAKIIKAFNKVNNNALNDVLFNTIVDLLSEKKWGPECYCDVIEAFGAIDQTKYDPILNHIKILTEENALGFKDDFSSIRNYLQILKTLGSTDSAFYDFALQKAKTIYENGKWDLNVYSKFIYILKGIDLSKYDTNFEIAKKITGANEWGVINQNIIINIIGKINQTKLDVILPFIKNILEINKLTENDIIQLIEILGNTNAKEYDSLLQCIKLIAQKYKNEDLKFFGYRYTIKALLSIDPVKRISIVNDVVALTETHMEDSSHPDDLGLHSMGWCKGWCYGLIIAILDVLNLNNNDAKIEYAQKIANENKWHMENVLKLIHVLLFENSETNQIDLDYLNNMLDLELDSIPNFIHVLHFIPKKHLKNFIIYFNDNVYDYDDVDTNDYDEYYFDEEHSFKDYLHPALSDLLINYYSTFQPEEKVVFQTHWKQLMENYDNLLRARMAVNFIGDDENVLSLGLDPEGEFVQQALRVGVLLDDSKNPKSPYKVHGNLLQKREELIDLQTLKLPFQYVSYGDIQYNISLNPVFLKKLSNKIIDIYSIPNVKSSDFVDLLNKLEERIKNPLIYAEVQNLLERHSFDDIKLKAIGDNAYLFYLLKASDHNKISAKFKCIIKHILSLSPECTETILSLQEEVLLTTLKSVIHCSVGIDGGVINAYGFLPLEAKLKSSTNDIVDNGYIAQGTHLAIEFIEDVIQEQIEECFSGANELMKNICGEAIIEESVHQGLYLRNLIGDLVGSCHDVKFDMHSELYYNNLLALTKKEALDAFYQYTTPKIVDIIKLIQLKVNQQLQPDNYNNELFASLAILLGNDNDLSSWQMDDEDINASITEEGVFKVLINMGLLKKDERLFH